MYEQTFSYEAHGQTLIIHLPKVYSHELPPTHLNS